MKQAVLKNFDLTYLPLLAMAIFVIAFTAYAIWAYSKSNKAFFEHVANIPLNDSNDPSGEKL